VYHSKDLVRVFVFTRSIKAVIAKHFEVFIRDMANEFLNKFSSRNSFGNKLVIFVSFVVESNVLAVIMVDSGHANNRSTKIASDIIDDVFGIGNGRFGINIETIGTVFVAISFYLFEGRSKMLFEFVIVI